MLLATGLVVPYAACRVGIFIGTLPDEYRRRASAAYPGGAAPAAALERSASGSEPSRREASACGACVRRERAHRSGAC